MSKLKNRVKRLEKLLASVQCPICEGKGKCVVTYASDDNEDAPEPQGCERCGRVNHIKIRYVKAPLPHERKDADQL